MFYVWNSEWPNWHFLTFFKIFFLNQIIIIMNIIIMMIMMIIIIIIIIIIIYCWFIAQSTAHGFSQVQISHTS